jgi:hypothetical protein
MHSFDLIHHYNNLQVHWYKWQLLLFNFLQLGRYQLDMVLVRIEHHHNSSQMGKNLFSSMLHR